MPKLPAAKEKQLKDAILTYPTKSDRQIGKMVGLSHPAVANMRSHMDLRYDSEFIQATAGMFIKAFGSAADYWTEQINKLEVLKKSKKNVVRQNTESGGYFKAEVPLEPMEILAIERMQSDLKSKILYQASQGQVREVIKLMRSGQLSTIID